MYSDGRYFCSVYPNAFIAGLLKPPCLNSEKTKRVDQRLFQASEVSAYVAPPFSQIDYGIAHNLTGTVICHISAPITLVELDTRTRKNFLARKHVVRACITANCNDVRVLNEEERVNTSALLTFCDQALLSGERIRVAQTPKIEYFKGF